MKYGKKVFVDKNELRIGKYPEQLANAIENSDAFIGELKSHYQVGSNLLVLDINETEARDFIYSFINRLFFELPNNWKFLILSREKVKNDCHLIDLSDAVDKEFLKSLFLKKAGESMQIFLLQRVILMLRE